MTIQITPKQIAEADTWVPMAEKAAIAEEIAAQCIDVERSTFSDGDFEMALPDRGRENPMRKHIRTLAVMVCRYLRIEPCHHLALTDEKADEYGAAHLMMQLERLKQNPECRNRVFDLLHDYKQTVSMVNAAIYASLQAMNDPASRIIVNMTRTTSPDFLQQQVHALSETLEVLRQQTEKE